MDCEVLHKPVEICKETHLRIPLSKRSRQLVPGSCTQNSSSLCICIDKNVCIAVEVVCFQNESLSYIRLEIRNVNRWMPNVNRD